MGIPLQFAFQIKKPPVCLCAGIAKGFRMGLQWQANGVSARGKTIEVFDEMILTLQLFLAGHYDSTVKIFDFPKLSNQILQADMMWGVAIFQALICQKRCNAAKPISTSPISTSQDESSAVEAIREPA